MQHPLMNIVNTTLSQKYGDPQLNVSIYGSVLKCSLYIRDLISLYFFQACLIAFTSEFIPKLVYKYEHSWEMKGYVNFTLATSPHQGWGEVGKTECRYRAFRDHEGSFTPSHYKILGLKLAFVIIFEVSIKRSDNLKAIYGPLSSPKK